MTKYPENALNHFQILNDSFIIRSLPIPQISWKSTHKVFSYPAYRQTQTDKKWRRKQYTG